MHSETSLYALTQVVREARRLLNSQRQVPHGLTRFHIEHTSLNSLTNARVFLL